MKHTYKAMTAAIAVAIGFLNPQAAFAAPITPDGSAPYGTDTYCYYPGTDFQPGFTSPEDMVCQPIPTGAWQDTTMPVSTPGAFTNVNIDQLHAVSAVVSEGTVQGTSDPNATIYEKSFFVQPSNPTELPLLLSADLSIFGHNPDYTTIKSVSAYVVVDQLSTTTEDPFTGTSGETYETVRPGSTYPVQLTATGEGSYSADVMLPTSTFQRVTNGVLNGYGWSFGLTTVVEMTVNGSPETFTQTQHFLADTGVMTDITNFSPDVVVSPGDMGVGASSYIINFRSIQPISFPPPEQPAVVTPPAPPAITTPAEPEHPRVNTGDVNSTPLWGAGLIALAAATAGLFLLRGRARNVER